MDISTALPGGRAQLAEENSALIDNALDLMVVLDAAGRILRANAASVARCGGHVVACESFGESAAQ